MQPPGPLVKTKRPDLIVITDDVYGTFVPGFGVNTRSDFLVVLAHLGML